MKRYVAFVAMSFEAGGGWEDVLTVGKKADDSPARSFDSMEEAIAAAQTAAGGEKASYWHVVDLHSGKIVARSE